MTWSTPAKGQVGKEGLAREKRLLQGSGYREAGQGTRPLEGGWAPWGKLWAKMTRAMGCPMVNDQACGVFVSGVWGY